MIVYLYSFLVALLSFWVFSSKFVLSTWVTEKWTWLLMKLQNSLEIQNLLLKMLQILLIPTKAEIHTQKYMCFWWWLAARRLLRHHLCKQILLLGYHNFHISTDNTFLMTKIASLSASAHLVATSHILTRDLKGLYNWSFPTFYVSTPLTIGEPVLLPFHDVIEKQGLISWKL